MIILEQGTKVSICLNDGDAIPAQITGCAIYGKRVQYQVAWWDGRVRRCEWLDETEISPEEGFESLAIGFHLANGSHAR